MKQKPDETLDHWVRQSLRQLPDAPPPGSSFDPERLWTQLRPDVQATPARRRIGWAWWVAAACLAGLTVGWFWRTPLTLSSDTIVTHRSNHTQVPPVVNRQKVEPIAELAITKPVLSTKRPVPERVVAVIDKQTPIQRVTSSPQHFIEANLQTPELPAITDAVPVVEKLHEPKPNIAVVLPKRRFRVVHENELRAEEEARPKLYRTEHFVRLGTGHSEETAPEEYRPILIKSLTNKPNQ